MEIEDVPTELVTAALAESPLLERFYLAGGGSSSDLRTDMSAALAVVRRMLLVEQVIEEQVEGQVIDLAERRHRDVAFVGPDRRRAQ